MQDIGETLKPAHFTYSFVCTDADGNIKWQETVENLVTTQGKNHMLDQYFAGSAYTAAFYLGLKGAGTIAVGDTLASHAGWSEVAPYTGNRPALSMNTASAAAIDADQLSFSINATATVAGAFVATAASGTSGVLYSASDFSAARSVALGDTLNVTLAVSFS